MARFRGALKYEVDWLGDGLYAHGLSDVTEAVDGDFTALFGSAKLSNPDRPILKPLVGHVTLMGDNYAPRSSSVFTPAELRQRNRFRVSWSDGVATVYLCTGWMQAPKLQEPRAGTKLTRYSLEGLTQQDLRRVVSLQQLVDASTTVASRTLVEDAMESSLESYTYDPTELQIFQFEGTAGAFVSQFGTVAGVFPMEHASGGYGLHSPLADPSGQVDIGTPDYVIADLKSEWANQFIRNYAFVALGKAVADRESFVQHMEIVQPGATDLPSKTIRLPALPTDQEYQNLVVTPTREAVYVWVWGYLRSYAFPYPDGPTEWFFRLRGAWSAEAEASTLTASYSTTVDPLTGETVVEVTFDNWNTAREWSWEVRRTIYGTDTFEVLASTDYQSVVNTIFQYENTQNYRIYYQYAREDDLNARRLQYDISFDIVTLTASAGNLVLENLESQANWGLREAKFPPWFSFDASDKIKARIDELAQPRHLHTVDFPLWQRDPGKSKVIAELDSGDYFRLSVQDLISGVDIAESVMVMNVEYLLGNGRTPTKRLTLIETGNPVEGNPLTLDGNPLFLDNNPLFLR